MTYNIMTIDSIDKKMFAFLTGAKSQKTYKNQIGQSTWMLLHALVDHYPMEVSETYAENLMNLLNVLTKIYPCEDCREHMAVYVREHPPRFENRAHSVRWMFNFHNAVNKRLNKPVMTVQEYTTRLREYSDVDINGRCTQCQSI